MDGDVRIQTTGETVLNQMIEGPVQYCWYGVWSTVMVCRGSVWQRDEARVAYRQLGYQGRCTHMATTFCTQRQPSGNSQPSASCLPSSSPPFVSLDCPDSEVSSLKECEVMAVWNCPCGSETTVTSHAFLQCSKGSVYINVGCI